MTEPAPSAPGDDVHPTALVAPTADLADGVRVGPYCRVGAGARLGPGARLDDHVVVEAGARIGAGSSIAAGVFIQGDVQIGDDVLIGPNAAFVDTGFEGRADTTPRPPTLVRDGASIGANASVLAGVTLGRSSVVGAGSVVTRDVPPFATVVGSPARITGYAASRRFTTSRRIRASALDDDELPLSIGRATLSRLPLVEDLRGSLTYAESPIHLPFVPRRVFTVFGVTSREVRGEHAHRTLHQILVAVHGECAVAIDDGVDRGEVMLDRPDVAMHLPPLVWGTQYRYSADGVLLVLASEAYDPDDYIRDYEEFQELTAHG